MKYTEEIRVRYNECDMQNVVFNANYWLYADDSVAQFVRHAIALEKNKDANDIDLIAVGFDFMLKTATGTWHKGATYGDIIMAACSVSRKFARRNFCTRSFCPLSSVRQGTAR